jgi:hypothetical protein
MRETKKTTDGRTVFRVRTLTGKEIELDIELDYKVSRLAGRQPARGGTLQTETTY